MPASTAIKHRETNKFRFKTFNDRIREINQRKNVKRIKADRKDVDPNDEQSELYKAMVKWKDLDLSAHHKNFRREIYLKHKTLALVMANKGLIIQALRTHLKVKNSLAVQSLLEMLVAVCEDLLDDFYPYYGEFFQILISLLHTKDSEQIEWVFICLTQLSHLLKRQIKDDLLNVLEIYSSIFVGFHQEYIFTFASQSFSYLFRKARNYKQILEKLFTVFDNPKCSPDGISRVVFEIVRLDSGHFDSCVDDVLLGLLDFLDSKKSNGEKVFSCILKSFELMVKHIKVQNIQKQTDFSRSKTILKHIIQKVSSCCDTICQENSIVLTRCCKLLKVYSDVSKGAKLYDRELIESTYASIIGAACKVKSTELNHEVCNLAASFMKSNNLKKDKSLFSHKIIFSPVESRFEFSVLAEFWKQLFNINPENLKLDLESFCTETLDLAVNKHEVINLLVDWSLRNDSIPTCYQQTNSFFPTLFHFGSKNHVLGKTITEILKDPCSSRQQVWNALILATRVKPMPKGTGELALQLTESFLTKKDEHSFGMAVASIQLYCTCTKKVIGSEFDSIAENLIEYANECSESLSFLFCLDTVINKSNAAKSRISECAPVKTILLKNLSSANRKVLPITLNILKCIATEDNLDVYDSLITAIAVEDHDTRTKFASFQRVSADEGEFTSLTSFQKQAVVRVLVSQFYLNCSDAWPRARQVLKSFSEVSSARTDEFWQILFEMLPVAFENAKNSKWWMKSEQQKTESEIDSRGESHFDKFVDDQKSLERIDHFNFRLQLVKAVGSLYNKNKNKQVSPIIESFNKLLVDLLFSYLDHECYLDHEYSLADSLKMCPQNLSDSYLKYEAEDKKVFRKRDSVETLVEILQVFSHFKKLNTVARSDDLKELYAAFLTHHNLKLQRVALKCVKTFEKKHLSVLMSFKDFQDPKSDEPKPKDLLNFKDSLTNFDFKGLNEEQRKCVMPVLLRLLYGRMRSSIGGASTGKDHAKERRQFIIRFVAVLENPEYLETFFDLMLKPIEVFFTGRKKPDAESDLLRTVLKTKQNAEETFQCVPIKKQFGFFGTLETYFKYMRADIDIAVFNNLYQTLLCMVASALTLNKNIMPGKVSDRHKTCLKKLKKVSADTFTRLLAAWPEDKYLREEQVNAMFEVLVNDSFEKLLDENIDSPTVELKLMIELTKRLRFYPLLAKKINGKAYSSVADALISVLVKKREVHTSICDYITEAFVEMLTSENIEGSEDFVSLEDCGVLLKNTGDLSISCSAESLFEPSKFSLVLLKPHIPKVIKYFSQRLNDKKKSTASSSELKLISIFSEHVDAGDKDLLHTLSKILIKNALEKCRSSRDVKNLSLSLDTLYCVMQSPRLLNHMAPLFSKVHDGKTRQDLVRIVQRACENDSKYKWTSEIVAYINKYDSRRLEFEVDFNARNIGFEKLIDALQNDAESSTLFDENCFEYLPVYHSCLFTLAKYSHETLYFKVERVFEETIKKIKRALDKNPETGNIAYRILIKELLLSACQEGMRSGNKDMFKRQGSNDESANKDLQLRRESAIKILRIVVLNFPELESTKGLAQMINESNPDQDSFQNLTSLNLLKKSRGMREFAKNVCPSRFETEDNQEKLAQIEPIPRSTVVRYLMPFVIQTIYTTKVPKTEKYFTEAAMELLQSCCSVMSWPQIKRLIKRTQQQIDKKSQSLDILRKVIAAIPFDLTVVDDIESKNVEAEQDEEEEEEDETKEDENNEAEEENEQEEESDCEEMEVDESVKEQSQKVIDDLIKDILPSLRKVLSRKGKNRDEDGHKKARVRTDIEDVKCKMNLVHTIVSTLSRCPPNILKEQLSYIVLKLTDYLRHKSYDVRQAARRAACDCIDLLGPDFLFTVLSQLRSELTRGAHKHVLLRCCCDMIQTLNNSGKAQSGDVDRKTMVLMVEIMQEDLFGRLGEDKRAAEVRAKIPEAKGNGHQRIYECLQFLGFAIDCNENCSETNRLSNIRALINPFYQQAVNTKEARVKHVIKDSFEKIKVGLMKSTFFEPIDYLNLVYSLLSENDLEAFFVGKKTEKAEKKVIKPGMRPESCLILNNAPRRQGMKPVVKNKKSNLHLIVEFALSLLHQVITVGVGCEDGDKRKIVLSLLDEDDEEQAETRNLLNKLVEICEKCLVAQHRETVKQALNCLKPLLRTNLSEMRARIEEIAKKIFKIIEDDDKGMGDAETTNIAFQTLTTLCNSDYKVALTDTNLRTLMVYADSKLLDTEQQGNSFKLVEAVLRRGFENDDVKSTMANIREIMIRNQSSDTRERASRLYFLYLRMFGPKMDKKKYTLNRQVEFVLQNFSFEYAANRLSVMDFMVKLIGEYPDKYVARSMHKDIFVMTMDRLGKDQEKRCREKLVEVIHVLLQSIDNNQRDELYNDFVIQRLAKYFKYLFLLFIINFIVMEFNLF